MSRGGLNDWPPRPVETSEETNTPKVLTEEPLIGRRHDDELVLRLLAGHSLVKQSDLELDGRKA